MPPLVWEELSQRELMEHYQDAVRQERRQLMDQQMIHLEQKGYQPEDWTWLDDAEQRYWFPDIPLPEKPPADEAIDLFERARRRRAARKAAANPDGEAPDQHKRLSGADWQFGGRDRSPGSPEVIRPEDLFGQQRPSGDQKGF